MQQISALILAQDLKQPQVFERHSIHRPDRQSELLVNAWWVYRVFGQTYLLLTVENRSASKPWVLERAEVRVGGKGQGNEIEVLAVKTEHPALPPTERQRVVVVFPTPEQQVHETVNVSLFEKDGKRHVKLTGIDL